MLAWPGDLLPPPAACYFAAAFWTQLSSARQMGFDGSYKGRLQLVALWKCFLGLAY